jgi:AcrR family transcriptional regulator
MARVKGMAGRPKVRRKGRRRADTGVSASSESAERLMAGALKLFSRSDFSAVTIKDIARAAGVTTALIYYYYDNKAALFRAALEYALARALGNYGRLREGHDDPVDLITDWFDINVELWETIRQLLKIMLDYRGSHTQEEVVDRVIRRFYDEECSIISIGIRQGIEKGLFRPVDPDQSARFVSTMLDGICVRSMIHSHYDAPAAIAELKAMFWSHLGYRDATPGRRQA